MIKHSFLFYFLCSCCFVFCPHHFYPSFFFLPLLSNSLLPFYIVCSSSNVSILWNFQLIFSGPLTALLHCLSFSHQNVFPLLYHLLIHPSLTLTLYPLPFMSFFPLQANFPSFLKGFYFLPLYVSLSRECAYLLVLFFYSF